jgi:hypothetical protein
VTISIRLVFAVNEVSSESRSIPSAPETFRFSLRNLRDV